MATQLSKNDIQALLYMLSDRARVDFSVQLRSPNIQLSRSVGINDVDENPIEHWDGNNVRLYLNPVPMVDIDPERDGMRLQVFTDYIDCVGDLRLSTQVNLCADMYHIYGERWQMALYDAVYKLFDGKVELDYPDIFTFTGKVSHKGVPKEWEARERFDDMPRIEDFDFSHLGDFSRRMADRLVEETNKPAFKRMFGNSLKKTDTGLEFVECDRNGGNND